MRSNLYSTDYADERIVDIFGEISDVGKKGPFGLKKMFTVDLLIKSIIGSIINWGCRIRRG